MTESTIPERHIRRQQKRAIVNAAIPAVKSLEQMQVTSLPHRLPDQWHAESFMPYKSSAMVVDKGPGVQHILVASAFAGGLSEALLGRRLPMCVPPTFSSVKLHGVYNSLETSMGSNTANNNGTASLWQWQQHHMNVGQQETLVQNRIRLGSIVKAAGTTSLVFGVKYGMGARISSTEGINDPLCNGIISSAAAGAARAISMYFATLPHIRTTALALLGDTTPQYTLFVHSKNHGARQILSREVSGAIVYFGTYEALKQVLSPAQEHQDKATTCATTILLSGGIAGAAYRGLMFSVMHGTGLALVSAMLRAIPAHAVLFWGYESFLSTTTA